MADTQRSSVAERVGVVVTTHEGPGGRLDRCLTAIVDSCSDINVVIVDNSSGNAPLDADRYGSIAHVVVDNCGFGAAVNAGVSHPTLVDRKLIAVLNDDVIVGDRWLDPLVGALDADSSLGAVQSTLVLSGTDPALINSLGVELDRNGAGSDIGYRMPESDLDALDVLPVDIITGGAGLYRRSFLDDVDGFDERLFLYYEDVDLCLRGGERGWAFACAPTSRVEHDMGASTDAIAADRRRLQERNRLIVAARFGTPMVVARALWLSMRRLRHQPRRPHRLALAQGVALMPRAFLERVRARRAAR